MKAALAEILRVLVANEVEFVVVGMTAGVLQGVPTTTFDVDVVHRRSSDNVERLLKALQELEAVYRHDPRKLRPQASHLSGPGHQLLTTRHGDLDCLGAIGDERGYEDLVSRTTEMEIGGRARVRVLDLATLIEMKERAGRPKDLAVLPLLRATLDESRRRR
jgi:predicted nucleotidyltransferase